MTQDNGRTTMTPAESAGQRTVLTDREITFLASQRLGRIATVDPRGRPRLVATGFAVNAERGTIELGGFNLAITRRVEDIRTNPHVSLIVDDVDVTSGSWHVRGVEIRGTAAFHASGAPSALGGNVSRHGWMEITPYHIRSWGLD